MEDYVTLLSDGGGSLGSQTNIGTLYRYIRDIALTTHVFTT